MEQVKVLKGISRSKGRASGEALVFEPEPEEDEEEERRARARRAAEAAEEETDEDPTLA